MRTTLPWSQLQGWLTHTSAKRVDFILLPWWGAEPTLPSVADDGGGGTTGIACLLLGSQGQLFYPLQALMGGGERTTKFLLVDWLVEFLREVFFDFYFLNGNLTHIVADFALRKSSNWRNKSVTYLNSQKMSWSKVMRYTTGRDQKCTSWMTGMCDTPKQHLKWKAPRIHLFVSLALGSQVHVYYFPLSLNSKIQLQLA